MLLCRKHPLKPDIKLLFDDVRGQGLQDLVNAGLGMDIQVDGLGQIQAEDTHDGFCIDHVSAGYQVEVTVKLRQIIHEGFYLVDGVQRNFYCFHWKNLLYCYLPDFSRLTIILPISGKKVNMQIPQTFSEKIRKGCRI